MPLFYILLGGTRVMPYLVVAIIIIIMNLTSYIYPSLICRWSLLLFPGLYEQITLLGSAEIRGRPLDFWKYLYFSLIILHIWLCMASGSYNFLCFGSTFRQVRRGCVCVCITSCNRLRRQDSFVSSIFMGMLFRVPYSGILSLACQGCCTCVPRCI